MAQVPMTVGGVPVLDIANCTCLRVRRLARQATQRLDARLAEAGLTVGQFGVLTLLYAARHESQGMSLRTMAGQILLDASTLTRTLKPLESAGLVASAPDPTDRRVRLLSITEAGAARLAAAAPLWRQAHQSLVGEIGPDITTALNGLLDLATTRLGPLQ